MGKRRFISHQNRREQRLKSSSEDFDQISSSRESVSSDENNISKQLKIPIPKQNGLVVRRLRQKRRAPVQTVYKNKKRSNSRVRQRRIPQLTASSPTSMLRSRNDSTTPLYLSRSKQSDPGVRQFREQANGHVESFSEHENLSSAFPSKSSKFHASSKSPLYTSVAFNDQTSICCKRKGCDDNTFLREERLSCSFARTSKQTASSGTRKLILGCIRNSQIPLIPIASLTTSSMTSSQCSATSRSFLKDQFARGISQCSTTVEVGSMETIPENLRSSSSTPEPPSLSESSQHSLESIYDAPPDSSSSQTSSKESWDSEDGIESIYQSFVYLNSDYISFMRNNTNSKPVSEENGHSNTSLKNRNSSKTSISPVKRQGPFQLQIDSLPSSDSVSPLSESKFIENVTGSIGRPTPPSAIPYHCPVKRSSKNLEGTNVFFEENVRRYSTLENKDSSISSLYPEESSSFSYKSNSEQSAHSRNKAKKKSNLISCFTTCLRPSSPQQESQT